MLNMLIIGEDIENNQNLFNEINLNCNQNIKILGIFQNYISEHIENVKIDLLLIDLDTQKLDLTNILNVLKNSQPNCKIILISKNYDSVIDIINRKINIFQFIIKPIDADILLKKIDILISQNLKVEKSLNILKLLDNFNFNKGSLSYKYILDCLNYCIENNLKFIDNLEKIYKEVGKLYNDEALPKRMQWTISKSIKSMLEVTSKETLEKFFPYNLNPPVKTFLNEILL